mgnify:CR=1 FL=1
MLSEKNLLDARKFMIDCGMFARETVICMLYVDYCEKYGKKEELYEFAISVCEKDFHINKDSEYDIQKYLKSKAYNLLINKEDYATLCLSLLLLEDRPFNFNVFTNQILGEFIIKLFDLKNEDRILDLGSGYGSFLAQVALFAHENHLNKTMLYGQEINCTAANCSKMLLEMLEVDYQIENVDALEKINCPKFTKGYVFPPFGLRASFLCHNKFNAKNENLFNSRTSVEWMFVFAALESMEKGGKLVALLPDGALFKASDASIRKYLIEEGLLEAVISLPANSFRTMGVKTSLLVFSYDNKYFKTVDGEEILKKIPGKGLSTLESVETLFNAYNAPDVTLFYNEKFSNLDYCLSLNALKTNDIYDGIENPTELSLLADVFRGSPLTISNFEKEISLVESEYQILTSSNIENGIIDFESLPYIENGEKYEKFVLQKNDLVITSKSTKVKIAVLNDEPQHKIIVTGGMLIVRPKDNNLIDSTYLKIFLDSKKGRQVLSSIQKGVTITTISFEDFKRIKVPCPAIERQRLMAKKYNSLLSIFDGIKKELLEIENKISSFFEDNSLEG